MGLLGAAKESVAAYLAVASREAESYLEAVGLLEDVDRILERRDAPECIDPAGGLRRAGWNSPVIPGVSCGIASRSPTETATWTGECSARFRARPRDTDLERTLRAQQEHEAKPSDSDSRTARP